MTAQAFLSYVADAAYLVIFVVTATGAIRRPRRVNIDAALFFGALAIVLAVTLVSRALALTIPDDLLSVQVALVMALPYLLLRLAADFTDVPSLLLAAALSGLGPITAAAFLLSAPYPAPYTLALVAYFVVVGGYATALFARRAQRTDGVTKRRMQAVALGSGCLTLAVLIAGFRTAIPAATGFWNIASSVASLSAGLSYFVGFSAPGPLRRYWHEPLLRAFLQLTTSMPAALPVADATAVLETHLARALGAAHVHIALWDETEQRLRRPGFAPVERPDFVPDSTVAARVFRSQQAMLVDDPARIDPQNAETYRDAGARSILAAPMTLEGRTFGVLVAFSDRPSLFAGDDLQILMSFADATAAFIARSELVQQAIDVRAEADSLQLKEEFLSAAAHDLRSPLTVLLGQAQLMRRRMRPGEDRAADVDAVESMLQEARRMRRMTEDLLDAARPETGRFIGDRTPIDLAVLAAEVATATATSSARAVRVEASPAVAAVDGARIVQVIENLLNNAIKFSPDGSEILVRIAAEDARAHITVRDSGIGIPAAELEIIFERFRRGSEVASHGFSGSGVGLYLCKRIVEEHDGQIWAESKPGEFTELHVVLPLAEE